MASAAAPGTVWVGFMDVVPVIGTVKEGVEWVLALHEGNEKVVREKETIIKNLLEPTSELPKKSMLNGMEKLSVSESPPSSQTKGEKDPEAAEPKSITEVKLEELLEYVRCVSGGRKQETKREAKEQAEEQKLVEEIKKEVLEKIKLIKPEFVMDEKLDTAMRSRRGEHVFNNNILKFHSKVLEKFKEHMNISNDPKYEMADLNEHTLDDNAVKNIQTNMVVHFLDSEFYVNANGILYGFYAKALCQAFLDVMRVFDPEGINPNHRERVIRIIDLMNNQEIYVDHLAKTKWINIKRANTNRFNTVKDNVVNMYRNERGMDWAIRVMETLRELFS